MTSIWLRPQGRQEQELQSLIDRLASEHQTVSFPPHLTVCSYLATSPCSMLRQPTSRNAVYCR